MVSFIKILSLLTYLMFEETQQLIIIAYSIIQEGLLWVKTEILRKRLRKRLKKKKKKRKRKNTPNTYIEAIR